MSAPEGISLQGLKYPEHDFAQAAEVLGTLSHPDIRAHHDSCIENDQAGNFEDESFYELGTQVVIHRFDEARMEKRDDHDRAVTFAGIAFTLADIHYQTGRYKYCAEELRFLKRVTTGNVHTYASDALSAVSELEDTTSVYDVSHVRTENSLY